MKLGIIEIPEPPKHYGSFGFMPARLSALEVLHARGVPAALVVRIKQLPQDQWDAAARQEGY